MRSLRIALVLLLTSSALVVVPGEGDAVVPGAIGRIAFVSDVDHVSGEIYVRDFAGSSPTRLTTNTAYDSSPIWSPDSTRIVFGRDADVWVMDPDGSNQTNLSQGAGTSNSPLGWSPDGMKILFTSNRDGDNDLWAMYADGSQAYQIMNTPDHEIFGAWSPDGETIAFSRTDGGFADIWLIDSDGTNERRLTTTPGIDTMAPAWSPDGTKLAYVAGTHPNYQIWIMGSDGSNPAPLASAPGTGNYNPQWAPDGSRIGFMSDRDGDMELWMVNPDGTNVMRLTDNHSNDRNLSWESVNRMPVVVDEEVHIGRAGTIEIAVLDNDHDPDGETLTVWDVTRMPSEGSVTINADRTIIYTHDGRVIPPGHASPYTDSFDYEIQDSRLGSAVGTVVVWIHPAFNDVPGSSIFVDDIIWLAEQGITRGCNPPDNTLFCPTDHVTRGQMAAFLVRARGYTAGDGADLFTDDNGSVFELSIDRLGTAGVTKGCNPPHNDMFCPHANVTRGQMAAFLVRAFVLPDVSGDLFVDDDGLMFENAINRLGSAGVSKGCNPPHNDMFCPHDYVTREQMAAFIHRAVMYGQE